MAPKITIKRPDAATFRGWTFVLVLGAVLAVVAMIDSGGLGAPSGSAAVSTADGSTGCIMIVGNTTDGLRVRSAPNVGATVVEKLSDGSTVDATTVVQDGFRQLEDGNWASQGDATLTYLTAQPGSTC